MKLGGIEAEGNFVAHWSGNLIVLQSEKKSDSTKAGAEDLRKLEAMRFCTSLSYKMFGLGWVKITFEGHSSLDQRSRLSHDLKEDMSKAANVKYLTVKCLNTYAIKIA